MKETFPPISPEACCEGGGPPAPRAEVQMQVLLETLSLGRPAPGARDSALSQGQVVGMQGREVPRGEFCQLPWEAEGKGLVHGGEERVLSPGLGEGMRLQVLELGVLWVCLLAEAFQDGGGSMRTVKTGLPGPQPWECCPWCLKQVCLSGEDPRGYLSPIPKGSCWWDIVHDGDDVSSNSYQLPTSARHWSHYIKYTKSQILLLSPFYR